MISIGPESMDAVETALKQRVEEHEKRVRAVLQPWGQQRKDGPLFVAYFERMAMQVFPPEPWVLPDGSVQMVSPWVAALPYMDGGEDELRRYMAAKAATQGVM